MRTLFGKDFHLFVARPQYTAYVILIVLVSLFGGTTGLLEYRRELQSDERWKEYNEETLMKIDYAYSLGGPGFTQRFRPTPLSVIARGADDVITSPFVTRIWSKQEIGYLDSRGPLSRFILRLDIATLFLLLVPLVVMYLSHTVVREEISQRTLQSNLLFGVRSWQIVASKLAAATTATLLPIICVYLLLVGLLRWLVDIDGATVGRALLILLTLSVYQTAWISLVFLIQIMASARRTILATAFCVWVMLVYVVPNAVLAHRESSRPLGQAEYFAALSKTYGEVQASYDAYREGEVFPSTAFEDYVFGMGVFQRAINDGVSQSAYARLAGYYDDLTTTVGVADTSLYYVAALIVTELAGTGVGDYLNFRARMIDYQIQFLKFRFDPNYIAWLIKLVHPTREQLRDWVKFEPARLSFPQIWERVAVPLYALIGIAITFFIAVMLILPPRLRRLAHAHGGE